MSSAYRWKEGEVGPSLRTVLATADGPVDLTGTTVKLSAWNLLDHALLIDELVVTIVDAAAGVVSVPRAAGHTDTPGRFYCRFTISDGTGNVDQFPAEGFVPLVIEPAGGAS